MGYTAKIQQITCKDFNQYFINFPRVFCKIKFLTFAKIFPQAPMGNF